MKKILLTAAIVLAIVISATSYVASASVSKKAFNAVWTNNVLLNTGCDSHSEGWAITYQFAPFPAPPGTIEEVSRVRVWSWTGACNGY